MSTYIDHTEGLPVIVKTEDGRSVTRFERVTTHSWADHTLIALRWHYPDRADRIANGTDPATLADLARWNALGRRSAA